MAALLVGRAQHFDWLRGLIAGIFTLNVADGVMTVYWVLSGRARESNPLMDRLLDIDPLVFMVVKLALVALGSVLLWRLRRHAIAVTAIFALFLVYYWLLLPHLEALDLRLIRRWLE